MHVMTKYIDTYKAAIAALEDYCAMQQIIDTTDQQIKDAYNAVTSVSSARLDGMPHAPNPRGGEDRTTSMSSARLLIQKRAGLCGVLPVLCLASGS